MDEYYDNPGPRKFVLIAGMFAAFGYLWLGVTYPWIWAGVTAIVAVLGFGWFTARILFRFEHPLAVWGLAPVFGAIWLLFFWVVFKLQSLM
jgi:hypothetical protein